MQNESGITERNADDSDVEYHHCKSALQYVLEKNKQLVFVFDEFDSVRGYDIPSLVLDCLRDLTTNPFHHASAIYITRSTLKMIEDECGARDISDLTGVCTRIAVAPFTPDALAQLWQHRCCRYGWNATDADQEDLFRLTGGHPYLASLILFYGWATKSLAKGIKQAEPLMWEYYHRLIAHLPNDELEELISLLEDRSKRVMAASPSAGLKRAAARSALAQCGLARWDDASQGYVLLSAHLSEFCRDFLSRHPIEEGRSVPRKRFAVAVSFPGSIRERVESVVKILAQQLTPERVLYDRYYSAEFARPDLDTYLQRLYHDEAELVVVFLCSDYQQREWCGLEWRAIRDLIKQRRTDIMLLRVDSGPVDGVFGIDGYIDIAKVSAAEVASLVLKRVVPSAF
jgi:hypothetical protein